MDLSQSSHTTCTLECLPDDVVVAILTAVCSTADLFSIISASTKIYHIFLLSKRLVLLRILSRDLGPVLRDAIAATTLIPCTLSIEAAGHAIEEYGKLLDVQQDVQAVARGLADDSFVKLIKINRSVQFLVDEFAARLLSDLDLIEPDACDPLTVTERWRIARALLRHHFLSRIDQCDPWSPGAAASGSMLRLLSIFKPWEVHQLTDIHCFICDMIDRKPRVPTEMWLSHGQKQAILRDVGALHARLLGQPPPVAELNIVANNDIYQQSNFLLMRPRFIYLTAGPLRHLSVNADLVILEDQHLRDELYEREHTMPRLAYPAAEEDLETVGAAPAAWVDGHGGLDCQRWACQAHREILDEGDEHGYQLKWWGHELDRWRWLGFAFWDRNRFELLKARLHTYGEGWMLTPKLSPEECKNALARW